MPDRSELALELTDAVAAAYQAIERAGNRAYKTFGLSQRAHAAMAAVDLGGPDGARPSDVASVNASCDTGFAPASAMSRAIHVLQELRRRLAQKSLEVVR